MTELLAPVRQWIGSPLRERIAADATRSGPRCPLLLGIGGTVLRGSIDLLVEREGAPPLVIDYKTDRLGGADPAERAAHYGVQRSIYALAVAEALGAPEVEVAYVFLERPEEPAVSLPRPRGDGSRPRRAGADHRPDHRARVPGRRPRGTRLVPLPRLPGAQWSLLRSARGQLTSADRRASPPESSRFSSFSPSPTSSSSAAQ